VNDEDDLRRALREGKVVLGGKEFPIKKVDPETIQLQDPNFIGAHVGTYCDPFPYLKAVPRNDPVTYYPELFLQNLKHALLGKEIARDKAGGVHGVNDGGRGTMLRRLTENPTQCSKLLYRGPEVVLVGPGEVGKHALEPEIWVACNARKEACRAF